MCYKKNDLNIKDFLNASFTNPSNMFSKMVFTGCPVNLYTLYHCITFSPALQKIAPKSKPTLFFVHSKIQCTVVINPNLVK